MFARVCECVVVCTRVGDVDEFLEGMREKGEGWTEYEKGKERRVFGGFGLTGKSVCDDGGEEMIGREGRGVKWKRENINNIK